MIESIVIDTQTGISKKDYTDTARATHDKWKDWGVAHVNAANNLSKLGFITVGIAGLAGSGKTFGMKTLKPDTNIWFNADGKNPTWRDGVKQYGRINSPTKFHVLQTTYKDILTFCKSLKSAKKLIETPVAFLLSHTENYKSVNEKGEDIIRKRIKTMGNLPNKLDLGETYENLLYTHIEAKEGEMPKYLLRTRSNGHDDCRTWEELFDTQYIPNDYELIKQKIINY